MTELALDLDRAVARKNILEHPFYVAWAEGRLTQEDLAYYSTQYYRQVEAFPGYLKSVVARLPEGAARSIVEENLADEVDDDHPGIWLRFAEALGVETAAVHASATEPETADCVRSFVNGTSQESLPFALGMLYGYESQTPAVSKTKIEGLRNHYGIEGPGLDYFELHGELDVEHSTELATALEEVCTTDEDRAEARRGAEAGAQAVWTLLDGVTRVRQVA